MPIPRPTRAVCATALAAAVLLTVPGSAHAGATGIWKNCTAYNNSYPHGVGKSGAHDHVSSGDPVTNFKHSTHLYNVAMDHNKRLDGDKDGIACEQH